MEEMVGFGRVFCCEIDTVNRERARERKRKREVSIYSGVEMLVMEEMEIDS